MSIGARIFEIRKSYNLTQERLAKILGLDPAYISKIEKDKSSPSESLLNHICCRFFISRKWLDSGEGDMLAPPEESLLRQLTFYRQDILIEAFFKILMEYCDEKAIISAKNELKNLMACLNEQAILEIFSDLMKERGLTVTPMRQTHRFDTGDPDLDRMINTLYDLCVAADDDMKGWLKVQFRRAFPADVVEEAQKKQKTTQEQASAG